MTIDHAALRKLAEPFALEKWEYDTYNGISAVGLHETVCEIPDHPTGDSFAPEQVTERGDWYRKSEARAKFIASASPTVMLALLDEVESVYQQRDYYARECLKASAELARLTERVTELEKLLAAHKQALRSGC